jgi:hypothetical protein
VAVGDIVPVSGAQFEETLASASPDVLREMIREFVASASRLPATASLNSSKGRSRALGSQMPRQPAGSSPGRTLGSACSS